MPTEPWATYPPELNAGRLTTGPGPATWEATATQWTTLAALVAEQAAVLDTIRTGFIDNWHGNSGAAIVEAFQPYRDWLHTMADIAISNANAAHAVTAAYASALGSMIPLTLVTANRVAARAAEGTAQAASAVAMVPGMGEIAGPVAAQATASSAELESQYAGMWAENSTVMNTYDEAVKTATIPQVPPPPPKIVFNSPIEGTPGTLADLVEKHGGSPELVQAMHTLEKNPEQFGQQLGSQVQQAMPQQPMPQGVQQTMGSMGSPMPSFAPVSSAVPRPVGSSLPYTPSYSSGYSAGSYSSKGRDMTDSEFRNLLSKLKKGHGGVRSMSHRSQGSGSHKLGSHKRLGGGAHGGHGLRGGLGSHGGGGIGMAAHAGSSADTPGAHVATLGGVGGGAAAGAASVFSGIPTSMSATSPASLGGMHGPMMGPMGAGMGRGMSGAGKSGQGKRIDDHDNFAALIDSVQSGPERVTTDMRAAGSSGQVGGEQVQQKVEG